MWTGHEPRTPDRRHGERRILERPWVQDRRDGQDRRERMPIIWAVGFWSLGGLVLWAIIGQMLKGGIW